jgi:hypothetical protein
MLRTPLFLLPVMLGLACPVLAQVYKSTDADGNVIYTDTPTTDSEEVQIQELNIADPVEVPEAVPEPEPEPKAAEPLRRQPGEELIGEAWVRDKDRNGRKRLRRIGSTGPANPEK